VPGALYLGGPGLARSYLGRPDLTAEAFRPDPAANGPGARLYATGDLARRRPDGTIEFLGRADHQVKLRGFRLELAEVEAALARLPGVREAAVLLREDVPGDQRLVAYLVASGRPPAESELRRGLAERLPDYMVPAAFVILDAFPQAASGKVDRERLPAPERGRGGDLGALVEPRSPLERELALLWQQVLGLGQVGVRDSFFELGGNSLAAVRLVGRLQQRYGRAPALADLFRRGTIEEVALELAGEARAAAPSPLVALRPQGGLPPFFCVHPAGGNAWAYRALAHHLGTEQPFYGLQALGVDSDHPPLSDLEAMARSYVEAVRRVEPRGPYRLGGWSFGGVAAYEMARQLTAAGAEVPVVVMLDTVAPGARPEEESLDEAKLLASFAAEHGLEVAVEELARRGEAERFAHLAEVATAAALLPEGSEAAAMRFLRRKLEVFKACLVAVGRYRPGPYAGPIAYLRATDQEEGGPAALDPAGGWARLTTGVVTVRAIAGAHDTIVREPFVQGTADVLRRLLAGEA
jgi:thioesterase domain-containing protein